MSLVRAGIPLLILLVVSFNSQATCIVKSQKMTLSPEVLTKRNNPALGTVLKKSSFAVQLPPSSDCEKIIKFSADVPGGAPRMKTPGIFQTNAKGVGMKMTLVTSSGREIVWPSKFSASISELSGAKIIIELIKADNGTLVRGGSGDMRFEINNLLQGTPLIDIYVPTNFVTVLNRSCQIHGERTRNITLPSVVLDRFKSPGSVAGKTPFDIHLSCAADDKAPSAVFLKWNGQFGKKSGSDGVLSNLVVGRSAAKGIGVQVLGGDHQPLNFHEMKKVELRNTKPDKYAVRFYSQYYQIDEQVQPGKIHASLYFNIDYQ